MTRLRANFKQNALGLIESQDHLAFFGNRPFRSAEGDNTVAKQLHSA